MNLIKVIRSEELYNEWNKLENIDMILWVEGKHVVSDDYETSKDSLNSWYKGITDRIEEIDKENREDVDIEYLYDLRNRTVNYLKKFMK